MTRWLSANWLFRPVFDDVEASGARFDSIGVMQKRLALIEYKVGVSEAIVRHQSDRPMSLEAKIAGGLRALYTNGPDDASVAANAVWDRQSPPLVAIAAERFSEPALQSLAAMLGQRGSDWSFDWAVWRWTGEATEELMRGKTARALPAEEYAALELPHLVGRAARAASRSLEELVALASPEEGRLLTQFAKSGRASGYRFRLGRTKLALLSKREERWVIVAAAYVGASADGLNVGIDRGLAGNAALIDDLEGARPAGFLNTNVLVRSADDLRVLFAAIGPALLQP